MLSSRSLLPVACVIVLASAFEELWPLQPQALTQQFPNGIEERPAMFGIPSYQSSLSGMVWYPPTAQDGCSPIPRPPSGAPVLMLLDRGPAVNPCSFVAKVKAAEAAGAAAAIIVNNVVDSQVPFLPYMADDGSGRNVGIPAMLIRQSAGNILKGFLAQNTTIWLRMRWWLPAPDDRVEVDFWTSANDAESKQLKLSFQPVFSTLGPAVKFFFHYIILDGAASGCTNYDPRYPWRPCASQCINSGRYCAIDPEHDVTRGLDGADVVYENLRQMCLRDYTNRTNQDTKWWTYVNCFDQRCAGSELTWNETCSMWCFAYAGVDYNIISSCVVASGPLGEDEPRENPVLKREMNSIYDYGIFWLPTLVVNNVPYRGSLTCPQQPFDMGQCPLLQMICMGYLDGTQPPACTTASGCPVGLQRDQCGICGGNGNMDACGVCRQQADPDRVNPGKGGTDVCGNCLYFTDPHFNNSGCLGCDGKPFSGKVFDDCGVCGGAGNCPSSPSRGISGGAIAAIVAAIGAVGTVAFCYFKRRSDNQEAWLRDYMQLQDEQRSCCFGLIKWRELPQRDPTQVGRPMQTIVPSAAADDRTASDSAPLKTGSASDSTA